MRFEGLGRVTELKRDIVAVVLAPETSSYTKSTFKQTLEREVLCYCRAREQTTKHPLKLKLPSEKPVRTSRQVVDVGRTNYSAIPRRQDRMPMNKINTYMNDGHL